MKKYTFSDSKNDIINAGFESMCQYNEKIYSVSIELKPQKLSKKKPFWVFVNESNDIEILKTTKEQTCDEIMIDGKKKKTCGVELQLYN